jgi:TRAP-type C4-dicarboxylate transport system permease small subunit
MTNATGTPTPAAPEAKSRTWLIIVIVLVVVCCLTAACVAGVVWAWNNGDQWLSLSRLSLGALA